MEKNIIILPDGTEISSGTGTKNAIKSVKTTDSVNVGEELALGSAFANIMEATILTPGAGVSVAAGTEVTLYKVDGAGKRTKKGVYILEKPTRPSANTIRLTGYDRMIKLDKDLTAWLQGLTEWPYRLIDFASMVCNACGLSLVTETIPNEDFPVNMFSAAGVTGRQLMRWIGEISCRFCRANADGDMELAWYEPSGKNITPSGDHRYFAKSLTYDTYQVAPVDAVQIRMADSTSGALWPPAVYGTVTVDTLNIRSGSGTNYEKVGTLYNGDCVQVLEQTTIADGTVWGKISAGWVCITDYMTLENANRNNPYVITGNGILLAKITEELIPYLQVIETELAGTVYTPCKVSIPATMDIYPGQIVDITDANGVTITALVMAKTTTGQRDTLECTGSATRSSSTAANNKTNAQTFQDMIANQTHEDIFNKLTKNGKIQGIYVQDGKWYINAELAQIVNIVASSIISGIIASKDGNTKIDLDTGAITSATPGSGSLLILGGTMVASNQNGKARAGLIRDASDGTYWFSILDSTVSEVGAIGEKNGAFAIRCSDFDLDEKPGAVTTKIAGWKTINGEKVLVAYD